ncbi:hypothetical protein AC578_5224 [Pseudocercospora eumusae]|uniref:CHCH domain-containing protein n=1 Tax=Pseudocercospora eumusae TaxID=321146 RepID=A0A139HDU1_9PEZI|nr:hypothetical protein AC578_5224 [Pseudocercospora eumusae]
MPRQSRGPAAAPKRPVAAPARPAPPPVNPQQQRPASTSAYPSQQQHAPPPQAAQPQASGGSGLFGQMASTAAGVAVGSSIGHAVGGWFSGGSSAPAAPADATPAQQEQYVQAQGAVQNAPKVCANEVQGFKRCMDDNQGNLTICGWYLDQLKACQAASSQY